MTKMKRLLLIADGPPRQGWGAPIVLDRHLRRLVDGEWEVDIACLSEHAKTCSPCANWTVLPVHAHSILRNLPLRGMYRLCVFLWERQIRRSLASHPDCVLAVQQGALAHTDTAAAVARSLQVPLNLLILDHRERWEANPNHRRTQYRQTEALFAQASRAWFVSERLIEEYGEHVRLPSPEVNRVLRPVPDGGSSARASWQQGFSKQPVVVHFGAIQPTHRPVVLALADALAPLGGKLILVEKEGNPTVRGCVAERGNVEHVPFFPTNRQAVEFVAGKAAAAVHMYAFPPMTQGWATASFPSKLMEFTQTGVPMLLLTPPGTALHDWARANEWLGLCDDLSAASLRRLLAPLCAQEGWERMAAQSLAAAQDEFSPRRIQRQFEDELVVRE